jgi:DNA methylase
MSIDKTALPPELQNALREEDFADDTIAVTVNDGPGSLAKRFVAPPFSVLDAKQGYWQERKRLWKKRGATGGHVEQVNKSQAQLLDDSPATSAFDPVLADCMYRWFAPSGGRVLDPFAGEAIKGIVAARLGYAYTGIDVNKTHVATNRKQAAALDLSPTWIHGDSKNLSAILKGSPDFDFVFTSPPYYDLEIYSKHEKDGSAFETYEQFIDWYGDIFRQAVARLKQNRFVVVKIGDVRDEKGFWRNLPGDSISCFLRMGLKLYNVAVLATPIGSMPQRAGDFPVSRKLVNGHQYVQVFLKGDDPAEFGPVEDAQ